MAFESLSLEEVTPLIKGLVWTEVVNHSRFFLGLHAGVVCGSRGSVLLPGGSGQGKSTLTAMLVASGLRYFSDEMAIIQEDFRVSPVPLALCVKETGISVLEPYYPTIRQLPLHWRADNKRVCYVPPPRSSLPDASDRAIVRAVVFPQYKAGEPTRLRSLSRLEVIERLFKECLVAGTTIRADQMQAFIDWISGLDCHEITYGNADQCISFIRSLTGDG